MAADSAAAGTGDVFFFQGTGGSAKKTRVSSRVERLSEGSLLHRRGIVFNR